MNTAPTSLTLQQVTLLRRIGDGIGLPAYILRPRNCAQDIELLGDRQLIARQAGELTLTHAGAACLRGHDAAGCDDRLANLREAHRRDRLSSAEL
jgi:hypothetical protein